MNPTPDFSHPDYRVETELGRSEIAGRSTYLATDTRTQQSVIIKQYNFTKFGSDWSGFGAYQRGLSAIAQLAHPAIPRYLDFFEVPNGFCSVREYKNAQPLSVPRSFLPHEIKQLAISLLEIIVYLQNQTPPDIHRNIKPENILIDEEFKVYLIDFGFPYIGSGGTVKNSHAGTVGFMPLEQLRNNSLAPSTDLYSLGLTLICAVTQTPSNQIERLTDSEGRINFLAVIPKQISLEFINWLEKMMELYPNQRYANAAEALEALNQIEIERSPEVTLKPGVLEFKATEYGETLTKFVSASNRVPDTLLRGIWEVAPHPNDPRCPDGLHAWISFKPAKFESNKAECAIAVDTSQLLAEQTYEREIVLQSNASPKTRALTVKIETAPLFTQKLPRRFLEGLFAIAVLGGWLGGAIVYDFFWLGDYAIIQLIPGLLLGGIGGLGGAFGCVSIYVNTIFTLIIVCALPLIIGPVVGLGTLLAYPIGFILGAIAGYGIRYKSGKILSDGIHGLRSGVISQVGQISLLAATFGLSIGITLRVGLNLWSLLALAVTGIPLRKTSDRLDVEQAKTIAKYRKSEPHLIKP